MQCLCPQAPKTLELLKRKPHSKLPYSVSTTERLNKAVHRQPGRETVIKREKGGPKNKRPTKHALQSPLKQYAESKRNPAAENANTTDATSVQENEVEEITVQQLLEKCDEAIEKHKKWPLFLDSNDSKPVSTFLGYQSNMLLDAKKGMLESGLKKTKSIEQVEEEWRVLAKNTLMRAG